MFCEEPAVESDVLEAPPMNTKYVAIPAVDSTVMPTASLWMRRIRVRCLSLYLPMVLVLEGAIELDYLLCVGAFTVLNANEVDASRQATHRIERMLVFTDLRLYGCLF